MKIAITSNGNYPGAKLDDHFGRCAYIVFYETITGGMEFFPNPFKNGKEGVGAAVAKLIASRDVTKIITAELGAKVKPLLDSLKIQIIIYKEKEKSVQDIINMLNH